MSDATAEGPIDVRAPGPGIARSLALCLVFYVVFIAAMIPAEFFRRAIAPGMDYFSTMVIPQIIAWFVTIRLGLQWSGVPLTTACPLRPFPLRIVPALLVASYGATILLLEMAGWIPMPESFRQGMVQQMAQANWLLFLLPVVVVAPVAEEMFFRGLLLRGYLARYSVTTADLGIRHTICRLPFESLASHRRASAGRRLRLAGSAHRIGVAQHVEPRDGELLHQFSAAAAGGGPGLLNGTTAGREAFPTADARYWRRLHNRGLLCHLATDWSNDFLRSRDLEARSRWSTAR